MCYNITGSNKVIKLRHCASLVKFLTRFSSTQYLITQTGYVERYFLSKAFFFSIWHIFISRSRQPQCHTPVQMKKWDLTTLLHLQRFL